MRGTRFNHAVGGAHTDDVASAGITRRFDVLSEGGMPGGEGSSPRCALVISPPAAACVAHDPVHPAPSTLVVSWGRGPGFRSTWASRAARWRSSRARGVPGSHDVDGGLDMLLDDDGGHVTEDG